MPVNNFNVGRDMTLQIVGYDGTIQNFTLLTNFDAKQETHQIKVMGMDGTVRFLELPAGWSGTFGVDRQDRALDDYFSGLESTYYSGLNVQAATITETIVEVSGATSQYRFTGSVFKLDDAGAWQGDKQVAMKVSWSASRRLRVQ
jgi:hypothetical protein